MKFNRTERIKSLKTKNKKLKFSLKKAEHKATIYKMFSSYHKFIDISAQRY